MSFLSQAYLLDKYGPRLTMAELAEVLGVAHEVSASSNSTTRHTAITTRPKVLSLISAPLWQATPFSSRYPA